MCYHDNCDGCVRCMKWSVSDERKTMISDITATFLGCALIEGFMEVLYKAEDREEMKGWVKESLVSSGAAATYAVLASTMIRMLNIRYGTLSAQEEHRQENRGYLYLMTFLSQILSGGLSFLVGLGVDLAIEFSLTHGKLDRLEKNEPSPWFYLGVPVAIVAAKTLSRFGIFQAGNWIRNKCCKTSNTEIAISKFLNNPSAQ